MFPALRRRGFIAPAPHRPGAAALLRELERQGHVDHAEDGAGAGRIYSLTLAGAQRLGIAADDLRSTQILLDRFLARCGERLVL